jgi:RNA polymerase sigma factor (sigma-70 family)
MVQPEESSKILFSRIRKDDRLALNTLFTLHYQNLCTFANTYLHHKEEAEECVSDVFVNIWKNRKNISIEKSFKAYLYNIRKRILKKCLMTGKFKNHSLDKILQAISFSTGLQYSQIGNQFQRTGNGCDQ